MRPNDEKGTKVKRTGHNMRVIFAVVTVLAVACSAPAVAQAAFKRTFLRQISSTPAGALSPLGVAVDSADDLWVGDLNGNVLDKFEPASAENKYVSGGSFKVGTEPYDVAIESATSGNGDLYVVGPEDLVEVYESGGAHAHLETWSSSGGRLIAIDNSPHENEVEDPSSCGTLHLNLGECFVYRVTSGENVGGIEKLNSKGEAEAFEASEPYVGGVHNSKITGAPGFPIMGFGSGSVPPTGIVVDPKGDIYVASAEKRAVYEFAASGIFVQEFDLPGRVPPSGVAFDPVSNHLLATAGSALDEFEAATGEFVGQITETMEGKHLEAPFGVSVDSHGDVYVVNGSNGQESVAVYSNGAFIPELALGAASARTGVSVTLNGTLNPDMLINKAPVTECYFQYLEEAKYQEALIKKEEAGFPKALVETAPCEHPDAAELSSPANEDVHPVHADVEKLTPGTTYRYRLVATSGGESGGTGETLPLAFTAPVAPGILATSAGNFSSTFADLYAQVDPHGLTTLYHFEYLTAASYSANGHSFAGPNSATSMPVPDADIGSGGPTGGAGESVTQHIGPLQPGTVYDFRVVAENAQGVTAGAVCEEDKPAPACTFATLPEAIPGLPDGRAYELVTPATKEGGSDMFTPGDEEQYGNDLSTGSPSEDGNGFLLEGESLFGSFPGAFRTAYVFHRDQAKGEWTYTALSEPSLGVQSVTGAVFDPTDLSRVGINDAVGSVSSQAGEQLINLLGPVGGPYTTVHADPPSHTPEGPTQMVGASRDLSHVVLESRTLEGQENVGCPGSEKVKHGSALCEWAGGYETLEDGEVRPELKLVDLAPGSETEPVSSCGAQLGVEGAGGTHQAVSANGSRVFFTAPTPPPGFSIVKVTGPGCWNGLVSHAFAIPEKNSPQVYVRIDGTSTLDVSEPEPGLVEPGSNEPHGRPERYPVRFVGASEDGSEVFFVTDGWLTANHPQVHDLELYECAIVEEKVEEEIVPKCKLTRISVGEKGGLAESGGGAVLGVQAVASEGTAVYFLAFGALAPGASKLAANGVDTSAPVNLYRYQPETATALAQMTYVATVSTNNRSDQLQCGSNYAPCNEENWYATPNGRYLLFYSEVDLTANADTGGDCDVPGSETLGHGTCGVLYRYDAQAAEKHEQSLICVSCNPNGEVTTTRSSAEFTRSFSHDPSAGPVRAMSNDGAYVFFDTPMPLVPQATNGTLDVYEWHEGHISLIGSGAEPGPSFLLGYSPYVTPRGETIEGGNVFIGTHAKLVAADTNRVGNIYDARICMAESPCIQAPPGETALCEGSSCQGSPVEPLDATPTSLTFSGPGDVPSEAPPFARTVTKKTTAKCKKGDVRKSGKCVRKHKRVKAKKSSDKRGAKR
jgi:hypothetical protein